ncbi:MAG: PilZ domain-containing protein [Porticoccus sp.]
MSDNQEEAPGGLAFTDNISITWKPVAYQPDDSHLALVNESNESFLRAVSAISEFSKDVSEDAPSLSQEISRLDLKLNLLLDLVSQLIYKQLDIPEMSRVTISSNGIEWEGKNVPKPNQTVFVQVYIQRGTPKPLCFYGKVVSNQGNYDLGQAKVGYLGLSGSAKTWLDKLIFRHHRRAIAFKKSSNS